MNNSAASGEQSLSTPYASLHGQGNVGYGEQAQAAAVAALNQPQQSSSNTATPNGRKRKASGVPGSRGVANLTPEQLAKKRANDREAQRAIRERTRNTIESLERRIKELESQQPFQELQRVVSERDRALAECEELKERLTRIAGIVGTGNPRLNGEFALDDMLDLTMLTGGGTELASLTAQQSPLPPREQHAAPPPQYHALPAGGQTFEQQHLHPDLRSPQPSATASPVSQPSTAGPSYAAGESTLRKWSPTLEQSSSQQYYHSQHSNGLLSEESRRQPAAAEAQSHSNGDRLGLNFLLDSTQHTQNSENDRSGTAAYTSPPVQEEPLYVRLPNLSPPTYPLDALFMDFYSSARQQLAAGIPVEEVIGPEYPSLVALQDPNYPHRQKCHPVSALFIDILSKFPDISGLPEKVASVYHMFLVLRWYICPCKSCYERMPEWMRPVPEQLERPHAVWIDYVPWPSLRRSLILTPVNFDDFFIPYTTTLSLHWPYPSDQVLIPTGEPNADASNGAKMNPVFETHLRDLRNWSLGKAFEQAHPGLIEGVRIEDPPR